MTLLLLSMLSAAPMVAGGNDDANNREIGIEHIQDYAPVNLPDLHYTDEDAQGWYNVLGNLGFTCSFNNANQSANESHFERPNDADWADNVDFAYFSGHGYSDGFYFSTNNPNHIASYDQMTLGDSDLEWLFLSACQVLQSPTWNQWKAIFASNGLHGMTGFHSVMQDTQNLGSLFAYYLTGTNGYSLCSIGDAWLYATHDDQPSQVYVYGVGWIQIRSAILCRAEYDPIIGIITFNYYDEYLPGYGSGMYSDPGPYSINWWYYETFGC